MDFLPTMIARAINATRPFDHNIDGMHSNQSMISRKTNAQKSAKNISGVLQSQTQKTSVNLNPIINNTETTDSIYPTEVTGI